MLEEIALVATDDAGEWWQRAAEARASLEPDGTLELELRTRALVESPGSSLVLEGVRGFSERTGQPDALLSALDRAVRGPRSSGAARKRLAAMLAERADTRYPTLAAWAREVERTGAIPASSAESAHEITRAGLESAAHDPSARAATLTSALARLGASFDAELARGAMLAARHEGDDRARAHLLGLLAQSSPGAIERARLRALEAAYARFANDLERAATACRDAIAQGHSDAEVATRLRRTRSHDPEVDAIARAAAWAAEAAHNKGPLRARALAELACLDESRGQIGRAPRSRGRGAPRGPHVRARCAALPSSGSRQRVAALRRRGRRDAPRSPR